MRKDGIYCVVRADYCDHEYGTPTDDEQYEHVDHLLDQGDLTTADLRNLDAH